MLNNVDNYLAYIRYNYYIKAVNCMIYDKLHNVMKKLPVNIFGFFSHLAIFLPSNLDVRRYLWQHVQILETKRVHLETHEVRSRQAI
jgi:hypothetical protein